MKTIQFKLYFFVDDISFISLYEVLASFYLKISHALYGVHHGTHPFQNCNFGRSGDHNSNIFKPYYINKILDQINNINR